MQDKHLIYPGLFAETQLQKITEESTKFEEQKVKESYALKVDIQVKKTDILKFENSWE